jgi:hypothetical protein
MAITRAEKIAYNNYVKEHQVEIEHAITEIKEINIKKKSMPAIKEYLILEEILDYINIIKTYIKMNDISLDMLDKKNETYLNNARKELYKILQLSEEIVGNVIDRSLKENEEFLEKISKVNPRQILNLILSIQNMITMVIKRMGEGSKWKWSFVDIQGRLAVVIKNFINFSDIQKYRDPRKEFFRERQDLLMMCKKNLNSAAQQYRTRYEVSTQVPADMLESIELLSCLRKINVLTGESDEATRIKNTIDALRARLEADEKKKEDKKKKSEKK